MEYNNFVRKIGLIGITNILVTLSSLILIPILTKNLSIEEYGIWVQVMTTITLIPQISTLGLSFAMIRYLSAEKNILKIKEGFYTILTIVFFSGFLSAVFILFFSKIIANLLFNGDIYITYLVSIAVLVVSIQNILLNYFRTFNKIKEYSLFYLIQTYLSLIIISVCVITNLGIFNAIVGLLISYIFTLIISFISIIIKIGFKIPKFHKAKEYLLYGTPTIPSNLSYWIVDSSDRYLIGILLGISFVGIYSPGYTLGNVLMMLSFPFSFILPTVLSQLYEKKEFKKVEMYLNYSLKYFLVIGVPSVIGLSLLSQPILLIITTKDIAMQGYLITPAIAISSLLFGVYIILSNTLLLSKKTSIIGVIWSITAIINIILNFFFIPILKINGAALATLIAYLFVFIIGIYYSNKVIKIDFDLLILLKILISTSIIPIIIITLKPLTILDILINITICTIFYFMILYTLKGIRKEEIKTLIKTLKSD